MRTDRFQRHTLFEALCICMSLVAGMPAVFAQALDNSIGPEEPAASEVAGPQTYIVRFRGRTLFEISAPVGGYNAEQRAAAVEQRLLQIAGASAQVLDELRIVERDGASEIMAGSQLVKIVSDTDAAGTGRTRRQLAADQMLAVRAALEQEFRDRSSTALMRSILFSVLATFALVACAFLFRKLHRFIFERFARVAHAWRRDKLAGKTDWLGWRSLLGLARAIAATLTWLLALLILYFYLEFVLSLFPWTRGAAQSLVEMTGGAISQVLGGLVDYLPNLFNIIVIVLVARFALLALKKIFENIAAGRLQVTGFYSDWAKPTYSLLRFLVIAIAAVMVFPYLPGSGSAGFKGVSVFVGLLLSLGAATAIGNVIAGVVITYMRPFKIGDRVKIADAVGDVLDKDLFVVRLRTIKNVDITVPNSLVLANHIINFTSGAGEKGLILNTSVTIGYDAPWKRVHECLIAAARKVDGIEAEPAPFVLQTRLDDFYVAYELNAYTRRPAEMADLYSRLHAAIQDEFNGADLEIMSPHYTAVRDGGHKAVPQDHLPRNYVAPAFAIWTRTPETGKQTR